MKNFTVSILLSFLVIGCASKVLDYDNIDKLEENREYEDLVKVKQLPADESGKAALESKKKLAEPEKKSNLPKGTTVKLVPKKKKNLDKKSSQKLDLAKKKKASPQTNKSKKSSKKGQQMKPEKRLPEYEDSENFVGRRPLRDPFRVGEKVRLSLTYFNITAGYMDVSVKPFVEVNGEKAYNFEVDIKSSSFFNRIYAVDDQASTYVSYNDLLPFNLDIKVRESKQVKEIRSFLDNKNLKGSYWEKKVTKEKGEQEKSIKWDIEPFSQNVISAVYYLRAFTLTPGKKLKFRVADDGKNYMFGGEVLRKEKLKTEIGKLDTIVVRPKITLGGAFKPMGEILIWLTDDDRKFVVRIESKIKIGTIIAKVKSIERGVD